MRIGIRIKIGMGMMQRMLYEKGSKRKKEIREKKMGNQGFGIVEVVLIILVVIGLVVIFKDQITIFVNSALGKLQKTSAEFIS